jgi:hypothetical protein
MMSWREQRSVVASCVLDRQELDPLITTVAPTLARKIAFFFAGPS